MRIVIVSIPAGRKPTPDYVTALARGMESQGHHVEILNAWSEDGRKLPTYEYIAVVAEQTSLFGGKMPAALSELLSASSVIGGKRGAAFLKKTYPFTGKAMSNLMRAMEKEGMLVNWSDVILSASHAQELGKRIGT
jgi:hypothetical protein